ncbi:hypothetical protein ABT340_35705 [Streptosporangium sp. NPDC000239]|uniref:hypothetical protein n=1 Tax=Streptosporangium sp. NPDC000239 TaxID=3154248 RepID=UPI0033329E5E
MPSRPLLKVDIEVPAWPAVDRARWHLAALQDATGRAATVAGAGLAGAGLLADQAVTVPGLVATAAATLAGLVTLRAWRPVGHQRATASVLYLMPGAGLAVLLVAERIVQGPHWGEALALAAWTVWTWVVRPAQLARRMLAPLPAPVVLADEDEVEEPLGSHPAARWWATNVAREGGPAAGTALEGIEVTGERAMRAMIRSTTPGTPVPDISIRHLSALLDHPEDDIAITQVPGRGAGVRRLTIGKAEAQTDPATVWAQQIAPVAMPGTVLTGIRVGRPGGGAS